MSSTLYKQDDIEITLSDAGEVVVNYKDCGLGMVVIGDLANGGDGYFAEGPPPSVPWADDPLHAPVRPGEFLVASWTVDGEFIRLHRNEVEKVRG